MKKQRLLNIYVNNLSMNETIEEIERMVRQKDKKYNKKVSIRTGVTVNFLEGNVNRAPKWISDCGFEWFYRFIQEPKRLFKRYFFGIQTM